MHTPRGMLPTNILVPTDFSPCAEHALDYACALAAKLGAKLHIVNAIGGVFPDLPVALTDQMLTSIRDSSTTALARLVDARRAGVSFGEVRVIEGDARDVILQAATDVHADLIVIGTHGRRGLSRLLLGSVAEHILRRAPCPVLTVRLDTPP